MSLPERELLEEFYTGKTHQIDLWLDANDHLTLSRSETKHKKNNNEIGFNGKSALLWNEHDEK